MLRLVLEYFTKIQHQRLGKKLGKDAKATAMLMLLFGL